MLVAGILYGVTCVQTWYYFSRYPLDPWRTKLLVWVILFSDTMHQVMISHAGYTYFVTNPANPKAFVWSLTIEIIFNCITQAIVQCFLTFRIYKLSKKNRLISVIPVMVLILGEIMSQLLYIPRSYANTRSYSEVGELRPLAMCINSFAASADVVIAVLLCSLLRQARTGFRKTNTMLKKMIMFTINTGLLTSICALGSLVTFIALPDSFINIGLYLCIGRLYCNSLLATLNARNDIRDETVHDHMDFSLSLQNTGNALSTQRGNISIKIDTQREYAKDEYSPATSDIKNVESD